MRFYLSCMIELLTYGVVQQKHIEKSLTQSDLILVSYGSKNKIDIYNALKKYVPQVITYDIGRDVYECRTKKELRELYWTEGKEFEHFKFVSQNMAAYIQSTLGGNKIVLKIKMLI